MNRFIRSGAIVVAATSMIGVLAACGDDDSDDSALPSSGGGESVAARTSASDAPVAPGPDGGASQNNADSIGGRKIIFNASLGLEVPDLGLAFNDLGRVAQTNGGFIEKSSFASGSDTDLNRAATATIRVPGDRYLPTLQELRTLPGAKVRTEGSRSTEVTEQYTDLQSRLRNLERTEQQYLKLLEQAKGVQEILTMTDRLDAIRGQIEQVQGRLNVLDRLTELASIDVTLIPLIAKAEVKDESGAKGIRESFVDSWAWSLNAAHRTAAAGTGAIVVLGWILIPVGLLALLVRWLHRRFPWLGPAPRPSTPPPPPPVAS